MRHAVVLLLLVLAVPPARADPRRALDETVERYFAGEEAQGYAWLSVGNASLAAGGALLAQEDRVLRALSYPLLAVGAIQVVAGLSSLARTAGRLADLRRDIAADPAAVRDREARRIGRINSLFKIIKITEYTLLGLGAAGVAIGGALRQDEVLGVGIGVAVEAALMLVLDHFAERRAHRYAGGLGALSFAVVPRGEGAALLVGFARRF